MRVIVTRAIHFFSAFRVQKVHPRLLPRPRVHPHRLCNGNPIPLHLIARRAQRALPRRPPLAQPAAIVVGTVTALNPRHLEGVGVLIFTRVRLLRFGESAGKVLGRGIAVVDGHDVGREDAGEVVAHKWFEHDDRRAHDANVELDAGPDCSTRLGVGDVGVVRKGHNVRDTDNTDNHHTGGRYVSGLCRALIGRESLQDTCREDAGKDNLLSRWKFQCEDHADGKQDAEEVGDDVENGLP